MSNDRPGRAPLAREKNSLHRAIVRSPQQPESYAELALSLLMGDRPWAAERAARQAQSLAHSPPWSEGWASLCHEQALAADLQPDLPRAIAGYRAALAFQPTCTRSRWLLSLALLAAGQLPEGFAAHESRWEYAERQEIYRDLLKLPGWQGQPGSPQDNLLLFSEYGYGDAIQFVRFAPVAQQRCQRIFLATKPALSRLFDCLYPFVQTPAGKLEAMTYQAPLLSLPRLFGTTLATIPAQVPYFRVPIAPEFDLGAGERRLRVAICWASRSPFVNAAERSLRLEQMLPLVSDRRLRVFSVQVPLEPGERSALVAAGITPLGDEFQDFADTAAVLQQMDLVLTVDTAVAHLAGALAIPTWVLLPYLADWRWLRDRTDSPWYPTLRLFRQHQLDDWSAPLAEVALLLRKVYATGTKAESWKSTLLEPTEGPCARSLPINL